MSSSKILVSGCGGLGCYSVEFLARMGIEEIIVADGDTFSADNMNRQLYCTPSTIGCNKADVARLRWPEQVKAFSSYINQENVEDLIRGCDAVVDALDNIKGRKLLAASCARAGIPFIAGAIGKTSCQVCAVFPEDTDMLDIIYPSDNLVTLETFSFTPAHCASIQAALVKNILDGSDVDKRTLYISDLTSMDFKKVKL